MLDGLSPPARMTAELFAGIGAVLVFAGATVADPANSADTE